VNEISIMCQKLGVNVWELIDAAATKPFGFMPFYPGPGLGGHCIPVDPLYLAWKLRTLQYDARFIGLADEVNSAMPSVVVQRLADALNDEKKSVNGSRILLCGMAYKRDVGDVRESPAFDIAEGIIARGGLVSCYDTHVATTKYIYQVRNLAALESYDCVVIVTDHSDVDYVDLCRRSQLVVDCRNATKSIRHQYRDKVFTL
jgi:UDP-N-acetyl-D-glucosamine dehydrogenase